MIKYVAVVGIEMERSFLDRRTWYDIIYDPNFSVMAFNISKNIMYYGDSTCRHAKYVLPIFKCLGVFQWMLFYVLVEGVF